MGGQLQGHAMSDLSVNEKGVEIRLPAQVFGRSWQEMMQRVIHSIGKATRIVNSAIVMTSRTPGEKSPRWKPGGLDALSWFVFTLKIPVNHELVRLWHTIDWTRINEVASSAYRNARGGRPAWAPAQLIGMLILMFLNGIAHETVTIARIQENIVWCWFCGFNLFGPFPTHDALYELRKRVGPQCFEQLLTIIIESCLQAGLVSNELVHFDLTPMTASAHRWSPYERAVILARALTRYLERLWSDEKPDQPFCEALRTLAAEVALEVLPHKGLKEVQPAQVLESIERWEGQNKESHCLWQASIEEIVDRLIESEEEEPQLSNSTERSQLAATAGKVLEQLPHTRGDGDARVGRTTSYTWFCGYLVGFVVDSLFQIITAVVIATGNVKQAHMAKPAMEIHIERVGVPKSAAMDSAFDHPEVHSILAAKEIQGHITSRDHVQPKDGGYGTDRARWPESSEVPVCPADHPLTPVGNRRSDGTQVYEGSACKDCSCYKRCHPKGNGAAKRFNIKPEEHRQWLKNRDNCHTQDYKDAQKKRFISEGRFGLAKQNHKGARAPYRSETMNSIAAIMIGITMNLRILSRHNEC
jgi:transposase